MSKISAFNKLIAIKIMINEKGMAATIMAEVMAFKPPANIKPQYYPSYLGISLKTKKFAKLYKTVLIINF